LPHETLGIRLYAVPMLAERLARPARLWRRPSISPIDLVVATAVAAVQIAVLAAREPDVHADTPLPYLLVTASAIALIPRRVHPRATVAVVAVATLAYWLLGYPGDPLLLAQIIAVTWAMVRGHRLIGWLSLATGYGAYLVLVGAGQSGAGYPIGLAAWLLAGGAGAELLRSRTEHAGERRLRRRQESLRRVGEERLRIARELHDVLAHNVSLINVQAGVALHLLDEHPEKAGPALAAIKAASAETLREMRSVLGDLRQSDESAPRNPAPSMSRLDELIKRMDAVGLDVAVAIEGDEPALPAAVDLAAYRVLQEALTNVVRHSEGVTAEVRVQYREDDLEIDVSNDERDSAIGPIVEGNGIIGMRERALGLGGELRVGHEPGGRFAVKLRLPLEVR
jgi:signal transduction histidine kinase